MNIYKFLFITMVLLILKISLLASPPKDSLKGHWKIIPILSKESFRAIQVLSDRVIWASGTHGTVIHSENGGQSWILSRVEGAEDLDFRSLFVLDSKTVIVVSAGESEKGQTRIYRSTDGAEHWIQVYKSQNPGIFLDAIQFWDSNRGLVLGDPYQGKFFLLYTQDSGITWDTVNRTKMPMAGLDEGAFAASNSSLFLMKNGFAWFGTGGNSGGRIFKTRDYGNSWEAFLTPILKGKSAGVFSIHFLNSNEGWAMGGDYRKLNDSSNNEIQTHDGGLSWIVTESFVPGGYTESFIPLESGNLLTVGPKGSSLWDSSWGRWKKIDSLSFHALSKYKKSIWAIGPNGLLGKWIF